MKRFIRYLYEYEQGKRLRNVGFVKVEQKDEDCTLNIHGKGLHMKGERKLDLYLFLDEGDGCAGIWQGTVDNVTPAINYRLFYTKEDVITPENFQRINGIILESETGRKYAAVWNDTVVDVGRMRVLKPAAAPKEEMAAADTLPKEEMLAETILPEDMMAEGEVREGGEEALKEELTRQEEPIQYREAAGQESFVQEIEPEDVMKQDIPNHAMHAGVPAEEEPVREEPAQEEPVQEIPDREFLPAEDTEALPPADAEVEYGQEMTVEPIENICGDTKAPMPEEHLRCTKIQRNDMARLPRCEWKWANNSFLLHGYYNYHHLAIIDDGERYRLGVPGVYHPQEAKAASTFGFSEFIPHKDTDMDLTDDEKSSHEQFGYWCRPIKRVLKTQ